MKKNSEIRPPVTVAEWISCKGGRGLLRLLDQTRLPEETVFLDCPDIETVWEAIKRLVVRGAPAIGVTAGYGMVIAAQNTSATSPAEFLTEMESAAEYLESSRPTAVNLSWAVRRVLLRAQRCKAVQVGEIITIILDEAKAIHEEDEELCLNIGGL